MIVLCDSSERFNKGEMKIANSVVALSIESMGALGFSLLCLNKKKLAGRSIDNVSLPALFVI